MKEINLDYTNVMDFISEHEIISALDDYDAARNKVLQRFGEGSEFLGWLDLPEKIDRELIEDIKAKAEEIRNQSDAFICIGIGGSYLGARACIEALLPNYYNQQIKPEIYFAGNSISSRAINDLLSLIKDRKVTVNVISKSGTTTEPALAFRVIWNWMIKTYGKAEAARRTIATTDASKGALRQFALEEGMKIYVIPDDVGGRFSVLTPVGLLPIGVAGIDVDAIMKGAADGVREFRDEPDIYRNPSSMYAVLRNILYHKGKVIEVLSNFEPQLHYLAEWWKQLFGESEGKNHKGIFPASCDFTTDLHSMGQWIQDGRRNIFETFLHVKNPNAELIIEKDDKNLDQLNYLEGRNFTYINEQALMGTRVAHREGGVPNMTINIPRFCPHCIGKIFYFFEWAVAVSGYMLGVNPFDQLGVEQYKKNMFALLGKPGYEEKTRVIRETLAAERKYFCYI